MLGDRLSLFRGASLKGTPQSPLDPADPAHSSRGVANHAVSATSGLGGRLITALNTGVQILAKHGSAGRMVSECIENRGVRDARLLDAMRRTPRHEFVPSRLQRMAYDDSALPIGHNQTITWPFVVAMMTETLDLQATDRVLEIGTGSGYQAAVLSGLVDKVYSIEIISPLSKAADRRFKRLGYSNVNTKIGDGYLGWPEHAPFDKIILTCSPEKVPQPLIDQLREGGRMVLPLGEHYDQRLVLLEKKEGSLGRKEFAATQFVPMTGRSEKDRTQRLDLPVPQIRNGDFAMREADGTASGWYHQRQLTLVPGESERTVFARFDNDEPRRRAHALQTMAVDGRRIGTLTFTLRASAERIVDGPRPLEKAGLQVVFDSSRGSLGRAIVATHCIGSFNWATVTATVKVPKRARELSVRIGLNGATGRLSVGNVNLIARSRFGSIQLRSLQSRNENSSTDLPGRSWFGLAAPPSGTGMTTSGQPNRVHARIRKRSLLERWNRRRIANGFRLAARHIRSGQMLKAVGTLRLLAKVVRKVPSVQVSLANVALRVGEPYFADEAIRAISADLLRNAALACRLASAELSLGNIECAHETLTRASKRFPESWGVWRRLGEVYSKKSEIEEALRCFRRAIELAPTEHVRVTAMYSLANCLDETGQKEDAIAVYNQIIALVPDETGAHWSLVHCQEDLDSTHESARTQIALLRTRLTKPDARRNLHYSLGHLYDRSRRPAEAFAHFHLANEIRDTIAPPWDPQELRRAVDGRIEIFQRDMIADLARHGSSDDSHVFIVGMPRSGTTLVEQILSSHSGVRGLGERLDIQLVTHSLRWELKSKKPYPWCAKAMSAKIVERIARSLAERRHREAGSCLRITTKLPEDFWDLGLIAILFPNARIIHCRRHPIDTCFSCYMQNFSTIPYATSLYGLAEVYRLYRRIMEHWRTVLNPESLFELSYEELIKRPEEVTHELSDFCGLSFEERCLRFYENRNRVATASQWQVRRPVYGTSVQRWERYREFLGPLLELEET